MEPVSTLLFNELRARQRKNAFFSLRAFAKVLDISPSHLSLLINGKKPLSAQQAGKIAEKLGLSPSQTRELIHSSSPVLKALQKCPPRPDAQVLSEHEFQLVADWVHFAILSLGKLKDNEANARWIAQRLGIDHFRAAEAFQRLQTLGFLTVERGRFRQKGEALTTTFDVPSAAIRRHHQQNLDLAKEKLETVDVSQREFTSVTIAMNSRKMDRAKRMIREFREKLTEELEDSAPTDVYTFALQFFPLTEKL